MMNRHGRAKSLCLLFAFLGPAGVLAACKAPQPFSDPNSLIIRADSALLAEVDSSLMAALERRVFTTRPERTFKITSLASGDTLWKDLRQWQQVIVLGSIDAPDVERLVRLADGANEEPPAILQARDVWARGQTVTVVLLPTVEQARSLESMLPELYSLLEEQYEEWVRQRMYASGVNDSLTSVLSDFGFTLRLPAVYAFAREDSVFRFRNVYPDPGTLLRSVIVLWREGMQQLVADSLQAWREAIGEVYYDPPQDVLQDGIRSHRIDVGELSAVELRGVWQDRSPFPAAGPFIVRALSCPGQNRTYYIDAWVYAPGQDKYPYVRQLEILLGSFRCSEELPATIGVGQAGKVPNAASPGQ